MPGSAAVHSVFGSFLKFLEVSRSVWEVKGFLGGAHGAIGLAEEMQAVVSSVSHSLFVLGSATKRTNGGGGVGVILARPWGAVGAKLDGGSRKIAISSFGARIPVSVKSKLRFRVFALQQASESRVKWVLDPVGKLAHYFRRHFSIHCITMHLMMV